jgi:hypothetical protein
MRRGLIPLALATLTLLPASAQAGMPSVTLNDLAAMRLQTISFFLMVFLVSAWLIQLLWNYLRKDFTFLPRLGYFRAVGLTTLWGLLFVLVLTMISGARELMTPGAWERSGFTYRLKDKPPQPAPADETTDAARTEQLRKLYDALKRYADAHAGKFPADRDGSDVPGERWQVPDPSAMRYLYVGGLDTQSGMRPLAYEPEVFGGDRLVLLANGVVARVSSEQFAAILAEGKK